MSSPLIKQIIRILFVQNPSPQLFIIGFYVVVFPHHEEVIRLYPASYIRELFRMLANGADRKLNSHVDISSRRITWNAKLGVDFFIQRFDGNINVASANYPVKQIRFNQIMNLLILKRLRISRRRAIKLSGAVIVQISKNRLEKGPVCLSAFSGQKLFEIRHKDKTLHLTRNHVIEHIKGFVIVTGTIGIKELAHFDKLSVKP